MGGFDSLAIWERGSPENKDVAEGNLVVCECWPSIVVGAKCIIMCDVNACTYTHHESTYSWQNS